MFRLLIFLRHKKVKNKELRYRIARLSNPELEKLLRREIKELDSAGSVISCGEGHWRLIRSLEALRLRQSGFEEVVHCVRIADDTFSFDWNRKSPSQGRLTTIALKERCELDGHGARVFERIERDCGFESVTLMLDHGETLPRPMLDERVARAIYGQRDKYHGLAIINQVEEKPDYWFVPVAQIGAFGFALPKRSLNPVALGSGLSSREVGLWAYEHGLLDSDTFDIEITKVIRRDMAMELLERVLSACRFRVFREILRGLNDPPLQVEGLDWRAITLLYEDAGRAFAWRRL
ncbi:MAG: hypothetical protein AAFQ65_02495 [Myxococcota bacterium]